MILKVYSNVKASAIQLPAESNLNLQKKPNEVQALNSVSISAKSPASILRKSTTSKGCVGQSSGKGALGQTSLLTLLLIEIAIIV